MERQSASMDIGQVQEENVVRTAKEGDGSENLSVFWIKKTRMKEVQVDLRKLKQFLRHLSQYNRQ